MLKIPIYSDYDAIKRGNFKVRELRYICKHYQQKVSGNKSVLIDRLYLFFLRTSSVKKIKDVWLEHLIRKQKKLRGPALYNRKLCVNSTDFLTLDSLSDTKENDFFSYVDTNKQIFGFEFLSIYNLVVINKETKNPYNRQNFPYTVKTDLCNIYRLSLIRKEKINIVYENHVDVSLSQKIEMRTVALCSDMDSLGNYTSVEWFKNLTRTGIIGFIKELYDIWSYRASLKEETKIEICPPAGNPFSGINRLFLSEVTTEHLQITMLKIIDKMINQSHDINNRILGTNYVLIALTLVSPNAAQAMPWLYESAQSIHTN